MSQLIRTLERLMKEQWKRDLSYYDFCRRHNEGSAEINVISRPPPYKIMKIVI